MRTVHVTTELPAPRDRVWQAMQHPASFLYVIRGLLGVPALAGRTDPVAAGEAVSGWILLFHVVPLHRHHIQVVAVDAGTGTIRTEERGGVLRRWDHVLRVEPLGEGTCRYGDTIEIDAGWLTPAVAALATVLYRYRQRRWRRLARRHLHAVPERRRRVDNARHAAPTEQPSRHG